MKGLPLGANKCCFLHHQIPTLGVDLFHSEIKLGPKALGKLLGAKLSRSLKELQGLLGRTNFALSFVPDYKCIVKPMIALLSSCSEGVWDQACT